MPDKNLGLETLTVFLFSVCWAAFTTFTYTEPRIYTDQTDFWIPALVFLAYLIAWLPVVLLPYDIATISPPARCADHTIFSGLSVWWQFIYIANFVTGYVVNDFVRSYVYSGAFTIGRKCRQGLMIARDWYLKAGVVTLLIFIWVAWGNGLSYEAWVGTYEAVFALANLYGILMFLLLLAHALVELPKRLYHLSSMKMRFKLYCYELGAAAAELQAEELLWSEECERLICVEAQAGGADGSWAHELERIRRERSETERRVCQVETRPCDTLGQCHAAFAKWEPHAGTFSGWGVGAGTREGVWTRSTTRRASRPTPKLANGGGGDPKRNCHSEGKIVSEPKGMEAGGCGIEPPSSDSPDGGAEPMTLEQLEALHLSVREAGFRWRRAHVLYHRNLAKAFGAHLQTEALGEDGAYKLLGRGGLMHVGGRRLLSRVGSLYARAINTVVPAPSSQPANDVRACGSSAPGARVSAAQLRAWGARLLSLIGFCLFTGFAALLLTSEAWLALYFTRPAPSLEHPAVAQLSGRPAFNSPLGFLLFGHLDDTTAVLSLLGVGLMMCCCWSLHHAQAGALNWVFAFRMESPRATDAGSLAFSSAVACRVAIMLQYNVNVLLLPPEAGGEPSFQTAFYCTFARKSMMLVAHHDYYLLATPLLLLGLCVVMRRDLLTRWRNYLTRWRGKPYLASFALGSMAITKHEDEGRKLLKRLLHARQDSAAAVLQRSIRSMLAQHRQPQHELQQQEQMSSE